MVDNANEETKSSSFVANSDHSSNESVSNQSLDSQRTPEENLNKHIKLKLLIPSIAAGSIIGKNGETISQIQAQTQARVKLSKPDELYPGTNDRVCLLSGTKNSILQLYDFISEKIREKPDVKVDCRGSYPRHMQVKIIVSSSTAGMIIGKGGVVIKDIKKTTNAFIQLSQKPEYSEIQERCVILAGEPSQTRPIVEIILNKILQDTNDAPLSDIVYLNPFTTPSPFPTGSPYAASNSAPHGPFDPLVHNTNQYSALTAVNSQASPNSNHLSHPGSNSNGFNTLINHNRFYSGTNGQRMPGNNQRFQFPGLFKYPNRSALQSQGYPDCAIDEIISALNVLNMYGFKLRNLSPDHYDRNPMQRLALPPTSSTHQTNYLLSNKSNPNDSMSLINHIQRNIDSI